MAFPLYPPQDSVLVIMENATRVFLATHPVAGVSGWPADGQGSLGCGVGVVSRAV